MKAPRDVEMYSSSFLAYLADRVEDVERCSRGSLSVEPFDMAMACDQGSAPHEQRGKREEGQGQRYGYCGKQGVGSRSHNDTYERAWMLVS